MDEVAAEELLGRVGDLRDEAIEFLERLVLAESPSHVPEAQHQVFELLGDALDGLGFDVRHLPGEASGGQLYAVPEGRQRHRPAQLVLGHSDTVWPLGTLKDMPLEVSDGVVRGPGVFDMKGGLTQMVFALRALRDLGLEPPLTPVVFINSDEEVGSRESTPWIRMLARRVERVFVLEPALGPRGKLKTARKGIGHFDVTVRGRAAHAGLDPQGGASAILELSHVIQKLFALNDPDKGISVNVGVIDGGLRPNVIAPVSTAQVDVRVPTPEDAERIESRILGLDVSTPGVTVEVEGRINRQPLERTPRNRAVWRAARRIADDLGIELDEAVAGGGSDGNTTSLFTATLDGLGAVGDGAHAPHEQIDVSRTLERCALLAGLFMEEPLGVDGRDTVPEEADRLPEGRRSPPDESSPPE